MPLPEDFHKQDGYPLVEVTVTLKRGGKMTVKTEPIPVIYGGRVRPCPGADFVAGNASRSFKHVFRSESPPHEGSVSDAGARLVGVLSNFLYCSEDEVGACTDYLVAVTRDFYEKYLEQLHTEIERWRCCTLSP